VDEIITYRRDSCETEDERNDISRLSIIDEFFEKARIDWGFAKHLRSIAMPEPSETPPETPSEEDNQLESTEQSVENTQEMVSEEE